MTHVEVGLIVSIIGLLIVIITGAIKLTSYVKDREQAMRVDMGKIELGLRAEMASHEDALSADLLQLERDTNAKVEDTRKAIGEQGHALRQHIQQIELWMRDNLVSKKSFEVVTERIEKSIGTLGTKFEEGMEKVSKRIDAKIEKLGH